MGGAGTLRVRPATTSAFDGSASVDGAPVSADARQHGVNGIRVVFREDGSAAHVLYQGGRVYEASSAGADWKGGAARMAEKGEARAVPGAAPAPARAEGLENNLDRVLTEAVMDEARSKGTRY